MRSIYVTDTITELLAPLHVTVYAVLEVGVTITDPEDAFSVEKLVPVHEVAFVEDHVIVDD